MTTKKTSSEITKPQKGSTNWDEVDKLTDKDIEEASKDDPDTNLPTEEDLKKFKPIKKK